MATEPTGPEFTCDECGRKLYQTTVFCQRACFDEMCRAPGPAKPKFTDPDRCSWCGGALANLGLKKSFCGEECLSAHQVRVTLQTRDHIPWTSNKPAGLRGPPE